MSYILQLIIFRHPDFKSSQSEVY